MLANWDIFKPKMLLDDTTKVEMLQVSSIKFSVIMRKDTYNYTRLSDIQYVSELSCMELGTGLGRDWDRTGTGLEQDWDGNGTGLGRDWNKTLNGTS